MIDYIHDEGVEISEATRLLLLHRNESKQQSADMMKLFDRLCTIAFTVLRQGLPFTVEEKEHYFSLFEECMIILEKEKKYISQQMYDDYSDILLNLNKIFSDNYILEKNISLLNLLKSCAYESIYIVIPEKANKIRYEKYFEEWCLENDKNLQIRVVYPSEYYSIWPSEYSLTVILGWYKRAIMRKIFYSYNTKAYTVLLYKYEEKWKKYAVNRWHNNLKNSQNELIVTKSFSHKEDISVKQFANVTPEYEVSEKDEYNELEAILRVNKYSQYVVTENKYTSNEVVEAIPVNFVGGYIAFYRPSHKVISASKIILENEDRTEDTFPKNLKMGDYVVVRERDKDLIKDMADLILYNSGMSDKRNLASKWKEVLKIEQLFYSNEEIYQKLQQLLTV